jgi:predicted nucleotidyltransferase
MPPKMVLNLNKNYKATIAELKKELVDKPDCKIDSLILYGLIARGDYGPESDIVILLISQDKEIRNKDSDISYDIDLKNGTVTSLLDYSPEEIEKCGRSGSPFIRNIMQEGQIIYDNGTWGRLLKLSCLCMD